MLVSRTITNSQRAEFLMTGFLGQRHSTEKKHGRIHISVPRCGERKVSGTRWWRSHGMFPFQPPYFAFVCAYLADICLIGNIVSLRLFNQKIDYSITVTTQINNISLLCLIGIWNFILFMFHFFNFFKNNYWATYLEAPIIINF